jgi:4-hydroxybenzoate polyprenyltransferase
MQISVASLKPATSAAPLRYLSCLRLNEILILQGSPLIGAAVAMPQPGTAFVAPVALLVAANVCLIAHVFTLNDWSNLTADANDPHKAASVFTAREVSTAEIGGLSAGLLVVSLLLFSLLGPIPFALSLAIAGLSALYSLSRFNWKGRPILSSTAHLAGGALHFLLGYAVVGAIDRRGLMTALFFALTFAAGHLIQEIRDYHGDAVNAIRTNAVTFGRRSTFAVSLTLFTAAHLLLLTLALANVLPRTLTAVIVLYPIHLRWSLEALSDGLTRPSVCRLQARYRTLYAIVGLTILVALWRA